MPFKDLAVRKAYLRKKYLAEREEILKRAKEKYWANHEASLEYKRKAYRANPEKFLAKHNALKKKFPERWAEWHRKANKKYKARLKAEVIAAYGSKCACCGEKVEGLLAIDHINNDGKEHRKQVPGHSLYLWLKNNGFPKDKFQLLCVSCNWGKMKFGICPHQTSKEN